MPRAAAEILVVDDDSVVREIAKALLEKNGNTVREAEDGEAAMASLKSRPADVVLIDILMPRKEGLETLIELKQRYPTITVFVMSASGARKGHDFLSTAMKFGADGILQKPFSPEQLLTLINSRSPERVTVPPISSLGN